MSPFFRSFEKSWTSFKNNWNIFTTFSLASFIILFLLSSFSESPVFLVALIANILFLFANIIVNLGFTQQAVLLGEHKKITYHTFFTQPKTWLTFFITQILVFLIVFFAVAITVLVTGLIILLLSGLSFDILGQLATGSMMVLPASFSVGGLIVGSIIFFIAISLLAFWLSALFVFIPYVTVAHPSWGPLSVFKKSVALTRGKRFKLMVLLFFLMFFNLMGFAVFGFGLLITWNMTTLTLGHLYIASAKEKEYPVVNSVE